MQGVSDYCIREHVESPYRRAPIYRAQCFSVGEVEL